MLPDVLEVSKRHTPLDFTDSTTGAQQGIVTCLQSQGRSGAELRLEALRRDVLIHVA